MTVRVLIHIHGLVQGVGFRPFIYRLANELHLTGQVCNNAQGVEIDAEGEIGTLETFIRRITAEKPAHARIDHLDYVFRDGGHYTDFTIQHSESDGQKTALILPDLGICPDCLNDILDSSNRRYRYPFTNCTHCGPRYSIIRALPYDRPNTTMRDFAMCPDCRAEYENPSDRRFHAQPNACPVCGPQLALWDVEGKVLAERDDALKAAADTLREGRILALKGLGGFQLLVDARSDDAVKLLRQRKQRPHKPFAVMFPTLESVRAYCDMSALEEELLTSAEAPIVLLDTKHSDPLPSSPKHGEGVSPSLCTGKGLGDGVSPDTHRLGVILPYTPLHHLLMAELGFPVVATSGNLSDETICIDEHEALERLRGIADVYLVHNRPIERPVDDSVVQVAAGRVMMLRRARGYAPLPVTVDEPLPDILAVGAHQKNTVALSRNNQIFISQHIGDLETAQTVDTFMRIISDLTRLYEQHPVKAACDLHPDYASTHHARQTGLDVVPVQHHLAHVLACMADNGLKAPLLGVSWDGTGYGTDGTIWGGEFLHLSGNTVQRAAYLRTFRLPGGEKAVREPRRTALGLMYEIYREQAFLYGSLPFSHDERHALASMLQRGLNTPVTSSAGRLFDGVAALLGLCYEASYEGQAAVKLEAAITAHEDSYEFEYQHPVLDWIPVVQQVMDDHYAGIPVGEIAAKFHNTLADMIVRVALAVGEKNVALTGGCFQNRYLLEKSIEKLSAAGFQPYWHQQIPPNDGGIAVGQIIGAAFPFVWKKE